MAVKLRGTHVKTLVRVSRRAFIGDFLCEVLNELTAGDLHPVDEIIELGIVKNQLIGEMTVQYIVDRGKKKLKIAEVTISIDWDRHRVNVAGLGEDLEIDAESGKIEQVSKALVVLFGYLDKYRKRTRAESELVFQWAPGVDAQEARKIMDSQQAKAFKWHGGEIHDFGALGHSELKSAANAAKEDRDLEYELTITPQLLDEIRLVARVTDEGRVLAGEKTTRRN